MPPPGLYTSSAVGEAFAAARTALATDNRLNSRNVKKSPPASTNITNTANHGKAAICSHPALDNSSFSGTRLRAPDTGTPDCGPLPDGGSLFSDAATSGLVVFCSDGG